MVAKDLSYSYKIKMHITKKTKLKSPKTGDEWGGGCQLELGNKWGYSGRLNI